MPLHFTNEGVLPPGDVELTLHELRQSILVKGPNGLTEWDAAWREHLVDNLEILVRQLWAVGVMEIFIDGSFVEDKAHPNDIDGYFIPDRTLFLSGELEQQLNLLDPHKIWTWDPRSRRPYRGYPKKQLPMWHQYRVELYPHYGQPTGVRDAHGFELEFPSLFRQSRGNGQPKGIIHLLKGST